MGVLHVPEAVKEMSNRIDQILEILRTQNSTSLRFKAVLTKPYDAIKMGEVLDRVIQRESDRDGSDD